MKVIFGTTNKRKIEDLKNLIKILKLNITVFSLNDIGWDNKEIDENGGTLEENSLIKANSILKFCKKNNICYPILTDDAGLFCNSLNGEPGIFTARYADDELSLDSSLPKYQCVVKLLKKLNNFKDRTAVYKCCVTCMFFDGSYFQTNGESSGYISSSILGPLEKPYFYSVFVLSEYDRTFYELSFSELNNTYRYIALKEALNLLLCNNYFK